VLIDLFLILLAPLELAIFPVVLSVINLQFPFACQAVDWGIFCVS
jgi:hypothetical protein